MSKTKNYYATGVSAFKAVPFKEPVFEHAHLPVLTADDVPNTVLMQTLYKALSMRRAAGTKTEAEFVAWLVNRLPVTLIDEAGNIHVDNRTLPSHNTMFTAHTDTVHHGGGANTILLDTSLPHSVKWRSDKGSVLGADDGAGVALMLHLLAAGVPGLYIFFRGEECGGIGSQWLSDNYDVMVEGIDRCISFDRADCMDVITHQAGGRCCSDAFADALAAALTRDDMSLAFLPDSTGVFTDSANLTDNIPEGTNLSVGYKHQHSRNEYQDVTFLQEFAAQLVLVQWDELPTVRDPQQYEGPTSMWQPKYVTADAWDAECRMQEAMRGQKAAKANDDAYLIDALYAALDGKHIELQECVGEFLSPEDIGAGMRNVDTRRIKTDRLEQLAYGLELGTRTAGDVLDELLKKAQIV